MLRNNKCTLIENLKLQLLLPLLEKSKCCLILKCRGQKQREKVNPFRRLKPKQLNYHLIKHQYKKELLLVLIIVNLHYGFHPFPHLLLLIYLLCLLRCQQNLTLERYLEKLANQIVP